MRSKRVKEEEEEEEEESRLIIHEWLMRSRSPGHSYSSSTSIASRHREAGGRVSSGDWCKAGVDDSVLIPRRWESLLLRVRF